MGSLFVSTGLWRRYDYRGWGRPEQRKYVTQWKSDLQTITGFCSTTEGKLEDRPTTYGLTSIAPARNSDPLGAAKTPD
jgi:hypothetical protein